MNPLTLLLALTLATLTLAVPEGASCSFAGFGPPVDCDPGLICVVKDFGNPPLDAPRTGICTVVKDPPNKCSVEFCTKGGAIAVCAIQDVVATCGAWAKRTDIGGVRPKCPEICTLECRIPRLVASNGKKFCNLCLLQSASCQANFKFFGPVDRPKPKCKKPISIFDAADCCIRKKIGCLKRREKCSTLGSRIRPVPCKKGLTCVIKDFGFPAADRPNSGKCKRVGVVKKCSVRRCSRFGPKLICKVPLPKGSGIISTCKAWARRSDGNPGPDCDFFCPQICAINKPVASNGKEFCSVCALQQASCAKDFRIFGPVKRT